MTGGGATRTLATEASRLETASRICATEDLRVADRSLLETLVKPLGERAVWSSLVCKSVQRGSNMRVDVSLGASPVSPWGVNSDQEQVICPSEVCSTYPGGSEGPAPLLSEN